MAFFRLVSYDGHLGRVELAGRAGELQPARPEYRPLGPQQGTPAPAFRDAGSLSERAGQYGASWRPASALQSQSLAARLPGVSQQQPPPPERSELGGPLGLIVTLATAGGNTPCGLRGRGLGAMRSASRGVRLQPRPPPPLLGGTRGRRPPPPTNRTGSSVIRVTSAETPSLTTQVEGTANLFSWTLFFISFTVFLPSKIILSASTYIAFPLETEAP
nr:uncharacterized protein LOC129532507 [Gorilla gorilla gorilla]